MIIRQSIEALCRSVSRAPLVWLLLTLIPTLPAIHSIRQLGLNTDVVRLLPDHSPAAMWTRNLAAVVGDGGFFTILHKGEDRARLIKAAETTAARVKALPEIDSVTFTNPREFIEKYRYLLISTGYLEKILDYVLSLKAELSPFTADLLAEDEEKGGKGAKQEKSEIKRLVDVYANLTPYHESADGTILGIFIRPQPGVNKIADLYGLLTKLEQISAESAAEFGIWSGVGGSQINNLKEYEVIRADLNRSGLITVTAIALILIVGFRSVAVLPVLIYPLAAGLLWAFALVPPVLGDLNIITSFLLMVLFGLGIDYSIHLVKRFQQELARGDAHQALLETYRSTGMSVITSGLTTGLALLVLAFSDFRGFAEFGLIGGGTMAIILAAMFTVMPPTLLAAERWGLVKADSGGRAGGRKIRSWASLAIALSLPFCIAAMAVNLRFDFNFNELKPKIDGDELFNSYNKEVYKTRYMSPGAIYLAPDLRSLDELLDRLAERMGTAGTYFLKATSVRDYAPNDRETARRLELIAQIREQLAGSWINKIDDTHMRKWAEDIRQWVPPAHQPTLAGLPAGLTESLTAGRDGEYFLVGLYPNVARGNGKNAMGFTRELYDLEVPATVQGPVGEMPVFAEILWTVTGEGPWVLVASFVFVFLLVFLGVRSIGGTVWITLPLISGMILTAGIMAAADFRLNFFNVVIFPALVGMGVDSGIHFYRRWQEQGKDTAGTLRELFEPLTICTVTSMMGYSGMIFASHPGLRSIGILACLGLGCIWLTSLVLFPGLLDFLQKVRKREGEMYGKS